MILTIHGVAGAAIANFFPGQPAVGVVAAFASHFALDAIPHWDYKLRSLTWDALRPLDTDFVLNRDSVLDLAKIALDFALGLILGWLIFGNFWGALAGMLPDFFQFLYFKFRWFPPLRWLQRFHLWVHWKPK